MSLGTSVATAAWLIALHTAPRPVDTIPALVAFDTIPADVVLAVPDTLPVPPTVPAGGSTPATTATPGALRSRPVLMWPDSVPRRQSAISYSDGYYTRLTIHRRLSYAMLPLFAASYLSGDRLLAKGKDAPAWARSTHRPAATATAVLFGVNVVTGSMNLWEGRHDADGRTARFAHALAFYAASAGFVYAGAVLAEQAETSAAKRRQHRTVALSSMGVSTGSWLFMLVRNR